MQAKSLTGKWIVLEMPRYATGGLVRLNSEGRFPWIAVGRAVLPVDAQLERLPECGENTYRFLQP